MKKLGPVFLLLAQTCVLCAVTLFCVAPVSCRITEEGIVMLTGDYEAPKLNDFSVVDEHTLSLAFNESVSLDDVVVSQQIEGVSDSMEHSDTKDASPAIEAASGKYGRIDSEIQQSEDGKNFTILLAQDCKVGESYELFGKVSDKMKNSLTFCIPFTGFNSHVPKLIMTELQIKYAKGSSGGKEIYRGEFVEFLVLEGGNLGGLELCSGSDGEAKKYCFPAVDVEEGQIFLVHLRTVGDGCVDERENFSEATAPHSVEGVLDLWSDNTGARLNDNADVVLLQNGISGQVLDAFMYADAKTLEWKAGPAEFAVKAAAAGVYETGDVSEATLCSGLTPLKSFQRDGPDGEWLVAPVTPGTL